MHGERECIMETGDEDGDGDEMEGKGKKGDADR